MLTLIRLNLLRLIVNAGNAGAGLIVDKWETGFRLLR